MVPRTGTAGAASVEGRVGNQAVAASRETTGSSSICSKECCCDFALLVFKLESISLLDFFQGA